MAEYSTVVLDARTNFEAAVNGAAALLRKGEVVAIPTETVYGLAASAYDESAVHKVFFAKGRPQDNPLIVHISNFFMLNEVVEEIPDAATLLAREFWPGPLTIILKKTALVCDAVTCGLDTVAIRMPSHPAAKEIIERAGLPLAAPSANLSGAPSPTTAQHVLSDMYGRIPMIIDGGACEVGVESTVLSLTGEVPVLLRPGIISIDEIRKVLPNAVVSPDTMRPAQEGEKVSSPGMKYRHYSPSADVKLVRGTLEQFAKYTASNAGEDVFAMCFDGEQGALSVPSISYGPQQDPYTQAQKLFAALRMLDQSGAKTVYVRAPQKNGVSMAVFNRLIRAAGFEEIDL